MQVLDVANPKSHQSHPVMQSLVILGGGYRIPDSKADGPAGYQHQRPFLSHSRAGPCRFVWPAEEARPPRRDMGGGAVPVGARRLPFGRKEVIVSRASGVVPLRRLHEVLQRQRPAAAQRLARPRAGGGAGLPAVLQPSGRRDPLHKANQVRGAQQLPAPARRPVVPRSLGRVVGALVGFVAVSLFAACGQPPGRVKPRSRLLLPLQLAPAGLPRLRAGR
mmetsp:Transcript_49857/g.131182  ORF Transcript_49857/g.131182 Transcript_49857/m.131182 type:complete len:220 (+) Transcript_49857:108-767(+)